MNNFTHLHVHTEFSLLDGSCKIKELLDKAKSLEMDSLAITDHGVMYGNIDFYKYANSIGIKPILGCEVYVATNSRLDRNNNDAKYYHLVLLAENNIGFENLTKIVSYGFTEGFYYKPRVDIEILSKYSNGLIALSACLAGPVARNFLRYGYDKARDMAILYNNIFGEGNFFLEMQDHGMMEQKQVNEALIKIHQETNIPMVCTNDVHYLTKEDKEAHEVLLCINTQTNMLDENRLQYFGDKFYLTSKDEMYNTFKGHEEALENTWKISNRCNVEIEFNNYKVPKFEVPDGTKANDYFVKLCYEGLSKRYDEITDTLKERLEYEISIITTMGFVDYFLIVRDFLEYAKNNNIMVGPGRGSGAASLASYCLNITNVDPIKFNLLFERFLNPERISMPDFDIDFCYERRQEVIDYVIRKYGKDHVAQIITFGTMAARAAIRDVGRALAISYSEVDRIAKMIPMELHITIDKALNMNSDLLDIYETDPNVKRLLDMSRKLEGLTRHSSTHAAGVVICDAPVVNYVPLNLNDDVITTQYTMTTVEELGLLKIDFLGLRTLTVIQNAVDEIKRTKNIDIDINKINYEDENVFNLISSSKTDGVFQLESAGMKSFMKELQPRSLEDIIAGISLYRPGPMDFIPKYIRGKNDKSSIKYTHEKLEPILSTTYGCIVYQEQVMQIVRDLAGYSLGRSDLVRKAMSKKKEDVMIEERKNFIYGLGDNIPGCIKNEISEEAANQIFDDMTDFAKYAFNKAHATPYAFIGYQTAWLKHYYPVEFMAALMTSVMDSSTKITEYMAECKKMGITVLPPDINHSHGRFSVSSNCIRYGLNAIKNVGRNVNKEIVNERYKNGDFTSLTEFINRMYAHGLNKRNMEALILVGAFDSLGGNRRQYRELYKNVLDGIINVNKRNIEGQISLFNMENSIVPQSEIYFDKLLEIVDFSEDEKLKTEKEYLGIYVSGHPLAKYETIINNLSTNTSIDFVYDEDSAVDGVLENLKDRQLVTYCGMIISKTVHFTKNNKAMAFLLVEDLYGTVEIIIFPNLYENYSDKLVEDAALVIKGAVTIQEEKDGKIIANSVTLVDDYLEMEKITETLWLKLKKDSHITTEVLTSIISKYKGLIPVNIYDEKKQKLFKLNDDFRVDGSISMLEELKEKLGEDSVLIKDNN